MRKSIWFVDELLKDSSIDVVYHKNLRSWEEVALSWKNVFKPEFAPNMPKLLRQEILQPDEITVARLKSPKIIACRLNHMEYKVLILTANGNLVRAPHDDLWDSCLPVDLQAIICGQESVHLPRFHVSKFMGELFYAYHSTNYTHFIYEYLAPLACTGDFRCEEAMQNSKIVTFAKCLASWQNDLFAEVGVDIEGKIATFQIPEGTIWCFELDSLHVPIKTNRISTLRALRSYFKASSISAKPDIPLALCTRNDSRRARIANADELEALVIELGGVNVDPARMSLKEKKDFFSKASLVIAESSGTMNPFLFSDSSNVLIPVALESARRTDLFYGGTTHNTGVMHRYQYNLCMTTTFQTPNGVMPSIYVDLVKLRHAIRAQL